jgi:hypothetical protein
MQQRHYPNRIAEIRLARGMRASDLARACDPPVSNPSVISKLENSVIPLTQGWCYRLAQPLQCRPWDFFPEVTEMPVSDQIVALWRQLDKPARADVLQRLIGDKARPIRRVIDDAPIDVATVDGAHKLFEFKITDNGDYQATLYYRGALPRQE